MGRPVSRTLRTRSALPPEHPSELRRGDCALNSYFQTLRRADSEVGATMPMPMPMPMRAHAHTQSLGAPSRQCRARMHVLCIQLQL